jgi:hypothetical protein
MVIYHLAIIFANKNIMPQLRKEKEVDRTTQYEEDHERKRNNEDWKLVQDPYERRKIQNRMAQRRWRE